MPNIITGDDHYTSRRDAAFEDSLLRKNFSYDYPEGLDLEPGSKLHTRIKNKILERARASQSIMSTRHDSWKNIDWTLTTYIQTDEAEKTLKNMSYKKPTPIVFPYSYAILETLLSYLMMAFFQSPMFRYEGVSPEDTLGAIMLEKIIEFHCVKTKVALALHTMFRDSLAYGFGVSAPGWKVITGKKTVKKDNRIKGLFGKYIGGGFEKVSEDAIIFEGNELLNIDPYLCLPDPNVSIHDQQNGEYFGWVEKTNYFDMLSEETNSEDIFNVKYLNILKNRTTTVINIDPSEREQKIGGFKNIKNNTISNRIDNINMYIKLIPKEWELGDSEIPEKWYFKLAADEVVVEARPIGLNHNMFPIAISAPDFDGYSSTPVSRMEILGGMQKNLDWLFNCYDSKTEVLTKRGWIPFPDTIDSDEVATVHPETFDVWFEKPKQWFEYDYNGYMVVFKSSKIDMCVTPNHSMFVKKRYKGDWCFKPAALLGDTEYKTISNINWQGKEGLNISLSGKKPIRDRGYKQRYNDTEIPLHLLVSFLGWFLSDGSISHGKSSGSYAICVKQAKNKNYKSINAIFDALPFHTNIYYDLNKNACQWTITNKPFYNWLKDNCYEGGTTEAFKKIPDFIKDCDKFTLSLLFENIMKGDGHWIVGHSNLGTYGSISKRLVDDLQEVVLKLGFSSSLTNKKISLGKDFYVLNINTSEVFPTIAQRNCFKTKYTGKVYCFENSTHLTITRRNGRIAIQGQSHTTNVKKSINDMFIIDPYQVNSEDLRNGSAGKLIRLRRPSWGKGVRDVIQQLNVTDVTRGHIQDSAWIVNWMQKIGATDDVSMGSLRQGGPERLTGKEFEGTQRGAFSRLERIARLVGLQAMQDIGYMFASHTKQLMSEELYVKTTGRWQKVLIEEYGDKIVQNKMKVSPFDILVDYDVMVRDGSVPGSNYSSVFMELFNTIAEHPELQQKLDIYRIFKHILRNNGVKNVSEFERIETPNQQGTVLPDEEVAKQVEAGNLVAS